MKAFFASIVVMAVIAVGSDYLLGGPVTNSGGVLFDNSSATVFSSPNVRLDDK